ncbi:LysM peptidoglycan-binding domain-containing protein [Thalassotalea mangrovi]|uniref:LysM peptidoglycan-binding domain-containing protein n=1 Tax=Thalassotalea mangrovi TaxID=2572245 RepID=A0A4U1B239_9GAMM|nr:LysM peptidoglycan-binding domain-containing protein [Thalassotalea mangrovi]TKB43363.1 LysM peptidoglycan-binding domain-containing protein [Thalassotalea mangrovi]
MKKLIIPLSFSLLAACQTTEQELVQKDSTNNPNIADNVEIYQALILDESANVIHPKADVNVPLGNDEVLASENIWDRIRAQLTFDVPDNRVVATHRNWYAKHQSYLDRVTKRAEPFLYYITEELEKNDMPMELVLLPVVESAYDPFAYSHGSAAGMWQFLLGTGKQFGLKHDWWYDGRRDVAASTQAAIDYLKYLNKRFDGDWLLALAAYNSGQGRVSRAMKRNAKKGLPTDFWSLDLPKETRDYVPKLLALTALLKEPEKYDIQFKPVANKPVISKVEIGSQLDLLLAAEMAGLTIEELHALNPGFNRWATAPDGPHYLLLPSNKVGDFNEKLSKLDDDKRLTWQRYKIRKGDSLSVIASKFNTTTSVIKKVNKLSSNNIRAGKYLLIPTATQSLDRFKSLEQVAKAKASKKGSGDKLTYTVKKGDTLWDIGRLYKVSSKDIAKWNGFGPKDTLRLGQKLVIYTPLAQASSVSASTSKTMRNIRYKVKSGDSLARIANKFNVTISDIEKWNNLSRKNYLQPGQMLKLSVNVTSI